MIYSGTKDGENFGFYLTDDDLQKVVELTEDEHRDLFEGQSTGKVISWDKETGVPSLQDPQPPTEAELTARRVAEIKTRLAEIDTETTRPLRAITSGTGTEADQSKVAQLEAEANALRTELRGLV